MLVLVNLSAGSILFPIELPLFSFGQVTIVSSHIGFFLVLDVLFAILQVRCLSRCQGAVLDAIGDAILLILLAAIDFIYAGMTRIDLTRSRPGRVLGLSSGGTSQQ